MAIKVQAVIGNLSSVAFSLERESNGNIWSTAITDFSGTTTAANSRITMTIGTGSRAGTAYGSLAHANLTAAPAGRYIIYIWDVDADQIVGTKTFFMKDGNEVETSPVYHMLCNVAVKATEDRYSVIFKRDNQLLSSGISLPKITVYKRSDASILVATTDLTFVGGYFYTYTEATNRIGSNDEAFVVVTWTHDGQNISDATIASRDR